MQGPRLHLAWLPIVLALGANGLAHYGREFLPMSSSFLLRRFTCYLRAWRCVASHTSW